MSFKFTVSDVIPAPPRAIYDAWLDSRGHSAMTGTKSKASAKVGGKWTAADDYCRGVNLELVPGKRIVQSWRSSDFKEGDGDSRVAVTLKPVGGGTVTLLHSSLPDGQKDVGYSEGWFEFYFEPMKQYFAKAGAKKAAKKKPAARK